MNKAALVRTLLAAAEAGLCEAVQCAIRHGVDINATDRFGVTALHEAALHGHMEVVKLLVEAGADRSAKTLRDKLPIDWARERNHTKIVQFLDNYSN